MSSICCSVSSGVGIELRWLTSLCVERRKSRNAFGVACGPFAICAKGGPARSDTTWHGEQALIARASPARTSPASSAAAPPAVAISRPIARRRSAPPQRVVFVMKPPRANTLRRPRYRLWRASRSNLAEPADLRRHAWDGSRRLRRMAHDDRGDLHPRRGRADRRLAGGRVQIALREADPAGAKPLGERGEHEILGRKRAILDDPGAFGLGGNHHERLGAIE